MSATGRARRGKLDPATPALFAEEQPKKRRKATPTSGATAPQADTGFDFYPTPVDAILPLLETDLITLPGGVWIDPCAGTGRIVRTVNEVRDDVDWILVELDERFRPHLEALARPGRDVLLPFGDFVHREWTLPTADVLIGNPPFEHAFAFVKAALTRAHVVTLLERQGFFGTQERSSWLREHCPDMFVLPKRHSFTPDGDTDSVEHAWFHWPRDGHDRRTGRVATLAPARGGQLDLLTAGAA